MSIHEKDPAFKRIAFNLGKAVHTSPCQASYIESAPCECSSLADETKVIYTADEPLEREAASGKPKMKLDDDEANRNLASAKSWLTDALQSIGKAADAGNDHRVFTLALQQVKYAQEALKKLAESYHPDARSAEEAMAEPIPEAMPPATEPDMFAPDIDPALPPGTTGNDLF